MIWKMPLEGMAGSKLSGSHGVRLDLDLLRWMIQGKKRVSGLLSNNYHDEECRGMETERSCFSAVVDQAVSKVCPR